ncbi:hypothetical protein AB0J77_14735 [Micromonospora tulbaghiae]|uniref:hypothetical protein n=1 Tax=Micromonospora tulbaghiae TaxID=479978 RepID=UPI00344ACB01
MTQLSADMPQLIVEIGFTAPLTGAALHLDDPVRGKLDTAVLAQDDLFTDVTQWVVSADTRRGATRADGPTLRYEAGTCTLELRNDDRRFDPTNLDGPYVAGGVTQVEPMRAVRIRASYGGHTWPLWRGFTDEWTVAYDGPDSSYATVTCFDAFGIFAAHDRNAIAPAGAGELTGARISRILNSIGWPAEDRMIDAGEETVQATTLADNVLSELLLTADTELGEFWVDAQGRVVFRSRSAPYTEARSTGVQAVFGDEVTNGVSTTVNLATNPSLEVDTSGGWAAIGGTPPTLSRSSTRARFGSWSLLATWGTGGFLPGVVYDITGLTAGKTYTISVYVWVPAGSPQIDTVVADSSQFGSSSTTTGQWERLVWTGTVSGSTVGFGLWPSGSPTAGQQVWIDGLQVEEGDTATPYVDGSQVGADWDGVPHASTSRRLPELDYADVTLTYDALSITNQVSAARVGGTEQTAIDAGSVSAYLTRSHKRTDLLMQTDPEALMWAEQVLERRSMPELRVSALVLKPRKDPDRLWPQAFGREIGDRVRVVRRPPGGGDPLVRDAWVRGISHSLSADLAWRTTLVLEQAADDTDVVDTFTRSVTDGWGTANSGEVWTVDTTAGGGSSSSGMLIGLNASAGANWAAAVADYPGIRYTRDFGKDNVWAPSDADTLTEPTKYGTGKFVQLPAGATMHLSWKDDPVLLSRWLDDLPALPDNHPGFYISPWHEPRDEVDAGDFTTAQFRAWGQTLSTIKATHPRGNVIKGVGPILTRFDIDNAGADPAAYGWAGMDFFGVDCYWSTTTGGYPTTTQMFGNCFAAVHADWPGIPLLVPEYGLYRQASDTTGSGRASAITTHVNYLRSRGDVLAVAYFNEPGSLPGAVFADDSPEADAWRALLASQGTSGGTAGAGDYSTTGTKGRLSLSTTTTYRRAWIPVGEAHVQVYARGLTTSAAPTGAHSETQVAARFVGASFVDARIIRLTGGGCQLAVRQVIGGSESAVTVATVPSVANTATLDVRLQAVGSTVRARAWTSGTTEPSTWLVSTTVSHRAAGDVAVGAVLRSGNTNTRPVAVDVDSVTVATMHAWA